MSYNTSEIYAWLSRCADRMIDAAPELNELDSALGDGDLGVTLEKCGKLIKVTIDQGHATPSELFKAGATACLRASGSSFGTLMAVALMTVAKETAALPVLSKADVGPLIAKVNSALMERGRCNLGDKTAVDSLEAIRKAIQGFGDNDDLQKKVLQAAEVSTEEFRIKPNKIGRARVFAEKSIGLKDPGMVAVERIIGVKGS
jgi:dihydroxyacetone kinase-like protein